MKDKVPLPPGYSFRELESNEFQPLWKSESTKIFAERTSLFPAFEFVSSAEQTLWQDLGKNMGQPYQLRLGLFFGEEFVGWHTGNQESGEKFYMRNSAVLSAHRKKGLYTALLQEVIQRVSERGFQIIYSRHTATNNAVIIPKLKAGFILTGMELSDRFGTLVHLSYFTNPLRRKMMDYRSGEQRPDEDIRKAIGL